MALRNIFVKGDDILRKTAREVKEVTERITILLDDMKETMESENGVGIATKRIEKKMAMDFFGAYFYRKRDL